MAQPPRRIQSPFVKRLMEGAGVKDEGADPNAWPKVLDIAAVTIEKAHEQKIITNGHVMAHAGGFIKFAMQFCPEEARGRVFDEFVSDLRAEITHEVSTAPEDAKAYHILRTEGICDGVTHLRITDEVHAAIGEAIKKREGKA